MVAAKNETALFRGHPVERLIFGTDDQAEIAATISRFAEKNLGSSVSQTLFKRTSVGVVAGLALLDGRRVVVKAHQPRQSVEVLQTVYETQRYLVDQDFPCPAPIIPPTPIGEGFATTETTHSPIFDFAGTAEGAEWIDELACEAKARVPVGAELLLVHSNWSGKHFRFNGMGEITVIYDWDSLGLHTELQALGAAAATFTLDFELDLVYAPEPDEVTAFISEYSDARGDRLNGDESQAAQAAAVYVIAYTARCERALGKRGDFTEALARFGRAYLT